MITLTKKEFECIQCQVIDSFTDKAYDLLNKSLYGIELDIKEYEKLKKLFLYVNTLWTWDQSKFDYLPYNNYMSNYSVQAILENVKEII